MSAPVRCRIEGAREAFSPRELEFALGDDVRLEPTGPIGPIGLVPVVADLLDVATSVLWIERSLPGHRSTNTPAHVALRIRLRKPERWDDRVRAALAGALRTLGNATWDVSVAGRPGRPAPSVLTKDARKRIDRVALLSGGMDSACGAATLAASSDRVQLVSFYTRHRRLQQRIASELEFAPPSQFALRWTSHPGRGRSFYYRSFFFLALAAAVAESYGARHILQYENGILASAIPPSPVWRMTRHAHPRFHRSMEAFLSALLGGDWKIDNPFFRLTKREAFRQAKDSVGGRAMERVLESTDTCWFHWSNRITGGYQKRPGQPCGVCVPCIVRRTARPTEDVRFDLRRDSVRNDLRRGRAFRSYAGFLGDVATADGDLAALYQALPSVGRELHREGWLPLPEIGRLFGAFAAEFFQTFELRRNRRRLR